MILEPRILARGLGIAGLEGEGLLELESQLAEFCDRRTPVDDTHEDEALAQHVRALAQAGLLRWVVPEVHGGPARPQGPDVTSTPLCLVRQWLARASGALDSAFAMQGLGSYPVSLAGSDAQRAALLPRIVRGEAIGAFALTEPEAGSDVSGMRTRVLPDGTGVRLEGEKCLISNAGSATQYVVFAREPDDGAQGRPRISAFLVPAEASGLSIERIHVTAPHPIGTLRLDGVAAERLGAPGQGLRIALGTLEVFRVTVGAAALGLADRALLEATTHLERRVQFGKPLSEQQGLRFALADVATEHVAAQLLVYRAATARDRGTATPDMAAMAKMAATESAQRAVDRAVQCLGGLGVVVGGRVEALYRDVRALRIYEGTTEIQKLVIARALWPDR